MAEYTLTSEQKAAFECSRWTTKFIDDGYGEGGWYACEGDPDSFTDMLETMICQSETDAIYLAVTTWPHEFPTTGATVPSP